MQAFLAKYMPAIASEHAPEVDAMSAWIHWLMLILFLGWGIYYIYVLVRFRASKTAEANYTGVTSHYSTYTEAAVVVIEAVLLLGFAFPLWAQRVNEFPQEQGATVVRVIAEQFAWNIHYPGPDGEFGRTDVTLVNADNPVGIDRSDPAAEDDIATINQLHLPVNKPVIAYITSKDVIHSFALQEMRTKQDAIPGQVIPVWFTPTVTNKRMQEIKGDPNFSYQIACAQLCGMSHYSMVGYVTIETQEEYDAWYAEELLYLAEELLYLQEGGDDYE